MIVFILDLVGVFAFAFFGASAALRQKFNVVGVALCAFLPALAGGTIRELLLGHTPFYFTQGIYGAVVIAAVIVAYMFYASRHVVRTMRVADAIGTITFAYFGALAAAKAGLGPLEHSAFGLLTAYGGGILCDIATRQTPHSFKLPLAYIISPLLITGSVWGLGAASAFALAPFLIGGFLAVHFILLQRTLRLGEIKRRLRSSKVAAKKAALSEVR